MPANDGTSVSPAFDNRGANHNSNIEDKLMRSRPTVGIAIAIVGLLLLVKVGGAHAGSAPSLNCPAFTTAALVSPAPQRDSEAIERFAAIEREVKSGPHRVLFLGDSLIQKWDPAVWEHYFVPIGALNAGVNGDRTENLLWRLAHGSLDGQAPKAVVLLIGTNDIGRNRAASTVAEGIRAILIFLRNHLPATRIILLGILPRGESSHFWRRRQVHDVNNLIQHCADGEHIYYLNLAGLLLDSRGVLSKRISPDGVHLSSRGYSLLGPRLAANLEKFLIP